MSNLVEYKPKQYQITEDEGVFQAVLGDVQDLGTVETKFGPKPKVLFWWILEETGSDGKPIIVLQRLTKSLHPASKLFAVLSSMLGKEPGKSVDLDELAGTNAMLDIRYVEREGVTRMDVHGVTRVPAGHDLLEVPEAFMPKSCRGNGKGPWSGGG